MSPFELTTSNLYGSVSAAICICLILTYFHPNAAVTNSSIQEIPEDFFKLSHKFQLFIGIILVSCLVVA